MTNDTPPKCLVKENTLTAIANKIEHKLNRYEKTRLKQNILALAQVVIYMSSKEVFLCHFSLEINNIMPLFYRSKAL